jgi:peptidoglycan/LPS O-acetylase OafA/YrhL
VTSIAQGSSHSTPSSRSYYPVLDAIRFVLAFWVLTSHVGVAPLFAGADTSNKLVWFVVHGWMASFYGFPAVICFFVISGFCIHLPFRNARKLPVGKYYARRYIRILIPVAGALAINRLIGVHDPILGTHSVLWQSALWSLLCEEIYYAIYPGLRVLRVRFGWLPILCVSFPAAVILLALHGHVLNWTDAGPIATTVIFYPIWLLGCVLAEQAEGLRAFDSSARIWTWRLLVWVASVACARMTFSGSLHYAQPMLWFGVLAYFWMRNEIAHGKRHKPSELFVFGGAWSYSLYLFHQPSMVIVQKLHLPNFGTLPGWFLSVGLILAMAYAFYVVIEKPSHKLARMFQTTQVAEESARNTDLREAAAGTTVGDAVGHS